MSAVRDIIQLGEALKAGEEKLARLASIEQATAEAEARLEKARAAEKEAVDRVLAAQEKAAQAGIDAERKARDVLKAAQDEADKRRAEFDRLYREQVENVERYIADSTELAKTKKAELTRLESEEAALGQSVAALRADLEAIRAKLA